MNLIKTGTVSLTLLSLFLISKNLKVVYYQKSSHLSQNFPNPFNPSTRIQFSLPERSLVKLKIYDVLGRELFGTCGRRVCPGQYSVNAEMSQFSSGIYFYQLVTPKFSEVRKMILVK
ncbi:MAG: T9SS type A sorting domain-containing protein [Ignavibacteriales bacterium]|nr:T9SS type A sorting domain-containing protein [Ignavibacteriales bacterium]